MLHNVGVTKCLASDDGRLHIDFFYWSLMGLLTRANKSAIRGGFVIFLFFEFQRVGVMAQGQ